MHREFLALLLAGCVLGGSAAAASGQATAQAPGADAAGDWVGVLSPPQGEIRIGIHIKRDHGQVSGAIDAPQFGAMGVPLGGVTASGNSLAFELSQGQGRFAGAWDAAKHGYVGKWTAPGGKIPLVLTRGNLPPPPPVDWKMPPVAGLDYAPAPAARARSGIALPVGKCMNMANQLEAQPDEGSWGPKIIDDDFRILKAAG